MIFQTLCDLSRSNTYYVQHIMKFLASWLENEFILEELWMIFESWQSVANLKISDHVI